MQYSIAVLLLTASTAMAADLKVKPIFTFSLAATNQDLVFQPEQGFKLEVFGDSADWFVEVSRSNGRGALLYPRDDWHGPHENVLSAWTHAEAYYPDERVIRVRGYQRWVRILLVDAKVSGEKGSERFSAGRAEIYWQKTPNKSLQATRDGAFGSASRFTSFGPASLSFCR
jgi:hypothetical protein